MQAQRVQPVQPVQQARQARVLFAGGTAKQLLRMATGDDYDTEWSDELDGVVLKNFTETEYTITAASGAVTVNRTNGGIQHFAPTGDVTLTWSLPAGAKQQLYVTPSTYVISWGGDYWMTDVVDTTGKALVHVIAENVDGDVLLWDGGSRT